MMKNGNTFRKCWRSKFEKAGDCTEVEGSVDSDVIAGKFMQHFSKLYMFNHVRAENLRQEYLRLRKDYCDFVLTDDLKFDIELKLFARYYQNRKLERLLTLTVQLLNTCYRSFYRDSFN